MNGRLRDKALCIMILLLCYYLFMYRTESLDTIGGVEMRLVDVTSNTDIGYLQDSPIEQSPNAVGTIYIKYPNYNTAINRLYTDIYTNPPLGNCSGTLSRDSNSDASDIITRKVSTNPDNLDRITPTSSRHHQLASTDRL